jgi:hypothetical protein
MQSQVAFLINLLQDVNIVRPVALLAARQLRVPIVFLLSARFVGRDSRGAWQQELDELATATGASLYVYETEFDAFQVLQGRRGVLVAASESSLPAHVDTHAVMRAAPAGYLRVTLQHGVECVGFLQSREHDKAHGRRVTFAADVACGWCDPSVMRSLAPSERSKYLLTGPPALLYARQPPETARTHGGLVCENLHSVRMHVSGNFQGTFMETFNAFCGELAREREEVTLRPHPGGQYILRNNVDVPLNVNLNNHPMYKVDLSRYAWGISAPSSVIVDMVLAGLPVAVWQDEGGTLDVSAYEGLTVIRGLDDWLAFARDARIRREMLLARQERFLKRSRMVVDRDKVRAAFVSLLSSGLSGGPTAAAPAMAVG